MKMLEKIHTWTRKHIKVYGMTLEELDEKKAKVQREERYKELLIKREAIAIQCYCVFSAHRTLYRDPFNDAYREANSFMEQLHREEWNEVMEWRKERGMQ